MKKPLKNKKEGSAAKNPFEVHINKQKMVVLGQKSKNDRGLPGVSRAKALQKRKATLLQEYKQQNKSNKFKDRRIGETNHTLNSEEKIMARFAKIRMKAHKKSKFNLADDEVLTHKGQTLSEIEKFDNPQSSDDESLDDNQSGKLDANFVENVHFGGGILKKTGLEGAKTHKQLIDELIAESKKRKAEKQKIKEATLDLTEKLDSEWKDLLPLVNTNKKNPVEEEIRPQIDDYDKVMRELKFEARGTVSDRLKTEEEIAQEEKDKLEQLEQERLERMQGFNDTNDIKNKHRSADDLDDDIVYESDPEYMLSYNQEGESNVEVNAQIDGKKEGEDEEVGVEEEEEESSEAETESEDDLSDLKAESSNESDDDETSTKRNENLTPKPSKDELPYTFTFPDSYDHLQKLFEGRSPEHQVLILERLIKNYHPSLDETNKSKLGTLFVYMLQHLNDSAGDFVIFTKLSPKIFELGQFDHVNAHNSIKEVIKEKHDDFKKRSRVYPDVDVLVFLRLASLLFTTSDFRHQVVTPCFVFMEQMLNGCKVKTRREISYGLFLVTLILEYTALSKRYLPAAINFLGGLLHMAIPKIGVKLIKVNPPFKPISNQLVLVDVCHKNQPELKMTPSDLIMDENGIDDNFKIRVLNTTLKIIEDYCKLLSDLPSSIEIFNDIMIYLELLPTSNYPESVRQQYELTSNLIKKHKSDKQLDYIVVEAKRPKALRLYEPKIEEIFDGKRRRVQSKEKAERDKLLHKLKKETKGALREIRRDKSFLGRVKIKQQIKSDVERKDKVKRIFSEAAIQQSELNSMDRKNKRKK